MTGKRTVRVMSVVGIPQGDIATLLELDPESLRKYFWRELDRVSIEATAKVAQTLFTMTTVDKNVAAAISWMKARAGWREKHEVQVSMAPQHVLSDAALSQIIEQGYDQRAITADENAIDEPRRVRRALFITQ